MKQPGFWISGFGLLSDFGNSDFGFQLVPHSEWDAIPLQKSPALRAFVRLFPSADAVPGRNRAGWFELQPLARTARRQPVQHRGELRRGLGRIFPEPRRGFEPGHHVVKLLAIGASDGLDGEMFAFVRAAGDAYAITASGTFKRIGAAHRWWSPLDKAPR